MMRYMIENEPVKLFMALGHEHDDFIPDDNFKCASDQLLNDSSPCR